MASGSREVVEADLVTPPGTRRVPGRRIGRPDPVRGAGVAGAATLSARSQPASISDERQESSAAFALSQADRRALKIGVSASASESAIGGKAVRPVPFTGSAAVAAAVA